MRAAVSVDFTPPPPGYIASGAHPPHESENKTALASPARRELIF